MCTMTEITTLDEHGAPVELYSDHPASRREVEEVLAHWNAARAERRPVYLPHGWWIKPRSAQRAELEPLTVSPNRREVLLTLLWSALIIETYGLVWALAILIGGPR